MSSVKIGWIGCGTHANEMLLPQLTRHGVALAALCDTDQARLAATAQRYGVASLKIRHHAVLLDNVETCAHVGLIGRFGAQWFRSVGTAVSPGSMLVTVTGAVGVSGRLRRMLRTKLSQVRCAFREPHRSSPTIRKRDAEEETHCQADQQHAPRDELAAAVDPGRLAV